MRNVNRDAVMSYLTGSLQVATGYFSDSPTAVNLEKTQKLQAAIHAAHQMTPADFDEIVKAPLAFTADVILKMVQDRSKPREDLGEAVARGLERGGWRDDRGVQSIPKRDPESRRDFGTLASGPMTGTDNGGAGSIPRRSAGLSNPPPVDREKPDTLDTIRERNAARLHPTSTFDGDLPVGFSEDDPIHKG